MMDVGIVRDFIKGGFPIRRMAPCLTNEDLRLRPGSPSPSL